MKIKVSELERYLKEYDQKQLIQLIVDLSKINKDVQGYLSSRFLGEQAIGNLFVDARRKIENEFFPPKGDAKLRLSEVKKAITTFEKLCGDKKRTTDLMLFYVEQGVEFSLSFGYVDESLFKSIGGMFEKVVSNCDEEEEIYIAFAERLECIVSSADVFDWEFHEYICETYYSLQWLDE